MLYDGMEGIFPDGELKSFFVRHFWGGEIKNVVTQIHATIKNMYINIFGGGDELTETNSHKKIINRLLNAAIYYVYKNTLSEGETKNFADQYKKYIHTAIASARKIFCDFVYISSFKNLNTTQKSM